MMALERHHRWLHAVSFRFNVTVRKRWRLQLRRTLSASIGNNNKLAPELDSFSLDADGCNVPFSIASKIGMKLHQRKNHPISIIHKKIRQYWKEKEGFVVFDDLSPIVSVKNNFDVLRIPQDHVSRRPSDTYYLNPDTVLRTHTSAHQVELMKKNQRLDRFLVTGDVYRRDAIDRSHYPIFHQTEGVKLFDPTNLDGLSDDDQEKLIELDLKKGLEGLAFHLFGPTESRWVDAYFPFTHPSFELEIYFQDEWMEVLGSGVIHPDVLKAAGRNGVKGYAFGLGLERLAMVLFQIPDIRLFWTDDARFLDQFASGEVVTFQPYSKFPPCYKDISFWLNDSFHVNDFNEVVRDVGGDLVEHVELIDEFIHPKSGQASHCYRILYRSMDRNLTNEEIDVLQEEVRLVSRRKLGLQLR